VAQRRLDIVQFCVHTFRVWTLEIGESAKRELASLKPFEGRRIVDAIQTILPGAPDVETRNVKKLAGVSPAFVHVPPVWELRVGEWRVYYDLDAQSRTVLIRAVRHKGNKTTQEVIK